MWGDLDSAEAQTAASVVLTLRKALLESWYGLLPPMEDIPAPSPDGVTALQSQLDACIVAFASFLLGHDLSDSTMLSQWSELRPGPERVVEAAVAMGSFVEALKHVLGSVSHLACDAELLEQAAHDFVRQVTRTIVLSLHSASDERPWGGMAVELEQIRVQRVERLAALTDIARAVSTASNPDELFARVHAAWRRIAAGSNFSIVLYDPQSDQLIPRLVFLKGERRRDLENRHVEHPLCRLVAQRREPLMVPDYEAACLEYGVPQADFVQHDERMAWMAAPMIQGEQAIGVICAANPLIPFEADTVALLAGIARHTAVALENHRLLAEQRRRTKQLKAINQLAARIVTLRDRRLLLSTTVALIHDLFGYGGVSIFLADPTQQHLTLKAHSDPVLERRLHNLRLAVGSGSIVGDVAASGQVARIGDVAVDPRYFGTPELAETRSEVAVPIQREGQLLGVLDVQSPLPNAFDEQDLTTLRTVADQIALALENAHLFYEEHARSRALKLMLTTTRNAGSSLVLDEVLERLAEGIAEAGGVHDCVIYLFDDEATAFLPAVAVVGPDSTLDRGRLLGTLLRPDESPMACQLLTQEDPFLCCPPPRPLPADRALTELTGGGMALAVPLTTKGRILGMALVVAAAGEADFRPEQIRLVRGVADSAALAIENARLYARSQGLAIAEERGRLAQEIHNTLAQGLTAISLHLDLADAYLPKKPELAAEKVRRALELTRLNLEDARRSVLDLRAAHLHQMSLPDALRRLVQTFGRETNIASDFAAEGLGGRLSARVEMGLYRIAEEALTNVRRHAGAGRVQVRLVATGDRVALTVSDDGVGFDPQAVSHQPGAADGFGLVSIRERARLLHGMLSICSEPGAGTVLTVSVPFEGTLAAEAAMRGSGGDRQ